MKKILLVDDSALIRFELNEIIEEMDFDIVGEAGNADEALKTFKETLPDIVTLDIVMPGKTGLEVLPEFFKIKPDVIIIMLTAVGNKNQLLTAIKQGAFDYIEKPIVKETVKATLKRALNL